MKICRSRRAYSDTTPVNMEVIQNFPFKQRSYSTSNLPSAGYGDLFPIADVYDMNYLPAESMIGARELSRFCGGGVAAFTQPMHQLAHTSPPQHASAYEPGCRATALRESAELETHLDEFLAKCNLETISMDSVEDHSGTLLGLGFAFEKLFENRCLEGYEAERMDASNRISTPQCLFFENQSKLENGISAGHFQRIPVQNIPEDCKNQILGVSDLQFEGTRTDDAYNFGRTGGKQNPTLPPPQCRRSVTMDSKVISNQPTQSTLKYERFLSDDNPLDQNPACQFSNFSYPVSEDNFKKLDLKRHVFKPTTSQTEIVCKSVRTPLNIPHFQPSSSAKRTPLPPISSLTGGHPLAAEKEHGQQRVNYPHIDPWLKDWLPQLQNKKRQRFGSMEVRRMNRTDRAGGRLVPRMHEGPGSGLNMAKRRTAMRFRQHSELGPAFAPFRTDVQHTGPDQSPSFGTAECYLKIPSPTTSPPGAVPHDVEPALPDVSPAHSPSSSCGTHGSNSSSDDQSPSPTDYSRRETSMTPNYPGPIKLWQFLQELLLQPEYDFCIRYLDKSKGIFKIEDSVEVARLWGQRKNRPMMNYDKMSRSIRQYYRKNIIRKPFSQRLVYQFTSEDH